VTDDLDGFRAPIPQKQTPKAVQAAGERLHRWAVEQEQSGSVDSSVPLLERTAPEDEALARDFRLMTWYVCEVS
jgi:hypothetical protein